MPDRRVQEVARLANQVDYDDKRAANYIDGAPHIKHEELRLLYGKLIVEVFDRARLSTPSPRVLDLGAGEGSVTLPLLQLGASVVAVDLSTHQLERLKIKCAAFADRLTIQCEDVFTALNSLSARQFDVIVINSFLHHVPDYMALIEQCVSRLGAHGVLFSFQDPLRYDTLNTLSTLMSKAGYYSWRVTKPDRLGGLRRLLRRRRGIYLDDSVHDNSEYHVTRNGVDQEMIVGFLEARGFHCDLVSYFSVNNGFFQRLGSRVGAKNTFGVIAERRGVRAQ